MAQVLDSLELDGCEFIDFGAGEGKVLLASIAKGAIRAHGYELPENFAHTFVLNAVLEKLEGDMWSRVHWIPKDINDVSELPCSVSCAYSFWVGIPLLTQQNILYLVAASLSIRSFAVFRDSKWRSPDTTGKLLACSNPDLGS